MRDDLQRAVAQLKAAGIPDAPGDARKLWEAAQGDTNAFARSIARRLAREPVSHILGRRAFWEHEFVVTNAVLDPRPDTETLVAAALEHDFATVLDLGTGSGCILLSLLCERPDAQGVGVDISDRALEVARINRVELGLDTRARLTRSDWFSEISGTFDLIVSNPPYIPEADYDKLAPEVRLHEPREALTPGGDGQDSYRILARDAAAYLNCGGVVLVEIGHDQGDTVPEIFRAAGWSDVTLRADLNGKPRVVCAKSPKSG